MAYNPFSLEGKTILITGASSGIGRATAIECSKMGATLIICGRNEDRLKETLNSLEGEGHTTFVGDLTEQDKIEELVNLCNDIDGVVLNAGKGLAIPFKFADREKFNDIFINNFFSPIELLRQLHKKKRIANNGSVVVMVSIGGTGRFTVGNSVYGASKSALNTMIRYCAQELSGKLVRVNGVCPGMVETPLIRKGTLTDEQLKEDMEKYPLKRYGKPEDVAMGVIYLLSDAASWVTGHSLVIDGGITAK